MQDDNKTYQERSSKLLDLTPDDKRNLVGFFALLVKVDKRINPAIYQLKKTKNA